MALLSLLCLGAVWAEPTSASASTSAAAAAQSLSCDGGARRIPLQWVNDGYCDCPRSGADEPLTGACASASATAAGAHFVCANAGFFPSEIAYDTAEGIRGQGLPLGTAQPQCVALLS